MTDKKSAKIKAVVFKEDTIYLYLDLISSLCNKHTLEATELIQEYCKRLKKILIPSEEFK